MKLCEIFQRPKIPERPSDFHLVARVAGLAEEDLRFASPPEPDGVLFFLFRKRV